MISEKVKCDECGYTLPKSVLAKDSIIRQPCPKCGSFKRNIFVSVKESIKLYEYVGLKAKKPSSKHKGGRADHEVGKGIKKGKDGRLVYKENVIDREHPSTLGSYIEVVKDLNGNVILDKREKLSEHNKGANP